MRVQYLNLVVRRARRHEKCMARDYDPAIEDDELYEKLREASPVHRAGSSAESWQAERPIDSNFDPEMFRRRGGRVG
jgi:hypothetical protein